MAPIFLLLYFLVEVSPWTIDLPEVRKYFFEKHENRDPKNIVRFDDRRVFDNINPDSPLNHDINYESRMGAYEKKRAEQISENMRGQARGNIEGYENVRQQGQGYENRDRYAGDYRDQSYMEKKVEDITHGGSDYLEGLRRALEAYGELLKNCSQTDFQTRRNSNQPWRPGNERNGNPNQTGQTNQQFTNPTTNNGEIIPGVAFQQFPNSGTTNQQFPNPGSNNQQFSNSGSNNQQFPNPGSANQQFINPGSPNNRAIIPGLANQQSGNPGPGSGLANVLAIIPGRANQQPGQQPINVQSLNQQPNSGQPLNQQQMNGQNFNQQPINGQPFNQQQINGQPFNQQSMNGQPFNRQQMMNGQLLNQQPINGQSFNQQPINGQSFNQQQINGQPFNQQSMNGQPFNQQQMMNGQLLNQQPINGQSFNQQPINGQSFNQQPINGQPFNQQSMNGQQFNRQTSVPLQRSGSFNQGQQNRPLDPERLSFEQCDRATRAREHVRRLAELAIWATRELQDRAYARHYDGHHEEHKEDEEFDEEEAELLLKLALFLDRLAYLTGFEPKAEAYITEPPQRTTTTTAQPVSLLLVPVPQPITQFYSNCLKNSSSPLPATERCTFPAPEPDELRRLLGIAGSQASTQSPPSTPQENMAVIPNAPNGPNGQIGPNGPNAPNQEQSPSFTLLTEVMLPAETKQSNGNTKSVKKRSIDSKTNELTYGKTDDKSMKSFINSDNDFSDGNIAKRSIKKRSIHNNPMLYFMKYYAKHKVWENDNSNSDHKDDYHVKKYLGNDVFDINNDIGSKSGVDAKKVKRSVRDDVQKVKSKKNEHLRFEDPFQDISNVAKHKPGVNYVKNDAQVVKIKLYLEKIRKGYGFVAKKSLKTLEKSLERTKRSIDTGSFLNSIAESRIQKYSVNSDKMWSDKVFRKTVLPSRKIKRSMQQQKMLPDKKVNEIQKRSMNSMLPETKIIKKRSIYYEKKVLPEYSRDPEMDISYYIKNKPGTDLNPDPLQAAAVRANLEGIFQNPNINTVHRYGSRGPVYANSILQGALITFGDLQ